MYYKVYLWKVPSATCWQNKCQFNRCIWTSKQIWPQ